MDSNSKHNVPNTVYHYTSPSGLLGIVDNGENSENAKLWFTRCDSLNDKSERCDIQKVLKKYKELRKDTIPKEFQDAIEELINIEVNKWDLSPIFWNNDKNPSIDEPDPENIYVCSFSTDRDSLPMWNYYSKSSHYEGYALGINLEKWKKYAKISGGYTLDVRQILYQEEDKIEKLDEVVSKFEEHLKIVQKKSLSNP